MNLVVDLQPIELEQDNNSKQSIEIPKNNERACPMCNMMTLKGMPGGRDATCINCGYKDPCCYD